MNARYQRAFLYLENHMNLTLNVFRRSKSRGELENSVANLEKTIAEMQDQFSASLKFLEAKLGGVAASIEELRADETKIEGPEISLNLGSIGETFTQTLTDRALLPADHPSVVEQRQRNTRFGRPPVGAVLNWPSRECVELEKAIHSALSNLPWRTVAEYHANCAFPTLDRSRVTLGMLRERVGRLAQSTIPGTNPRLVRSKRRGHINTWPEHLLRQSLIQLMREKTPEVFGETK